MSFILRQRVIVQSSNKLEGTTRLNVPPLRLCSDVLEYIFLLGASRISDPSLRRSVVLSYAQVCRDWRGVALSSKFLWLQLADFDFMPWPWNNEMLRRSHPLPVVMGSNCCLRRDARTVEAELEHIARIKAYRLGFTRDTWGILVEKLQRPAEQINSLSLAHVLQRRGPHSSNSLYDDQAASFVLPFTLFSLSAPHLRHLSLRGCFLDIRSPIYTQLTSLAVLEIDSRYNMAPTALEWLSLLSQTPQIRRLHLQNAIYPPDSPFRRNREGLFCLAGSSLPPGPILSKLESLHLSSPMTEVASFLSGMEIPTGCVIFISCRECRIGTELDRILEAAFRGLAQSIDRSESSLARSSQRNESKTCSMLPVLFYGYGSTLYMRVGQDVLWNSSSAIHQGLESTSIVNSPSIPDFTLSLDTPDASWQSILSPLLAILSDRSLLGNPYQPITSNITSLELALPSPHPDLIPFLVQTRNVEALVNLTGHFGAWLLEEMRLWTLRAREQISGATDAGANADCMILPRLQVLSFSDDECLYGRCWSSLELFLESRVPASLEHDDGSGDERVSFSSTRQRDEEVSRILRVVIRNSSLSEHGARAVAFLGVTMDSD